MARAHALAPEPRMGQSKGHTTILKLSSILLPCSRVLLAKAHQVKEECVGPVSLLTAEVTCSDRGTRQYLKALAVVELRLCSDLPRVSASEQSSRGGPLVRRGAY